jgi:hypothetical protein
MDESLTKVLRELDLAAGDLLTASYAVNPVEFLVVLPLVRRLAELRNDVAALVAARKEMP